MKQVLTLIGDFNFSFTIYRYCFIFISHKNVCSISLGLPLQTIFKMDQDGGPQQVVDIVEASSNSKGKGDRVDSCYSKTATVLGILHILCGVITLYCGILIGLDNYGFFLVISGTLTSIFSFISGGLAIGGAQSGSKCLVVATMVMSIISAVIASFLLFSSANSYYVY